MVAPIYYQHYEDMMRINQDNAMKNKLVWLLGFDVINSKRLEYVQFTELLSCNNINTINLSFDKFKNDIFYKTNLENKIKYLNYETVYVWQRIKQSKSRQNDEFNETIGILSYAPQPHPNMPMNVINWNYEFWDVARYVTNHVTEINLKQPHVTFPIPTFEIYKALSSIHNKLKKEYFHWHMAMGRLNRYAMPNDLIEMGMNVKKYGAEGATKYKVIIGQTQIKLEPCMTTGQQTYLLRNGNFADIYGISSDGQITLNPSLFRNKGYIGLTRIFYDQIFINDTG
jgi:hypothetical protein